MRPVGIYIAILFFAACDSNFERLPPVVPTIQFDLSLQAPGRAVPGVILLSGDCGVVVGGLVLYPERLDLKIDGVEVASDSTTSIEAQPTVNHVGRHAVVLECAYQDSIRTKEHTLEIVEPAHVKMRLRDFGQDAEPILGGGDPISFIVGDHVYASPDSVVADVVPDSMYRILADRSDLLPYWARVVRKDTGELIAFLDKKNWSDSMYVGSDISIDFYRVLKSDITSIPNTFREFPFDYSPYYTIENLRKVLLNDPDSGVVNRITDQQVTVWTGLNDYNWGSGILAAVAVLFVNPGPSNVSNLTSGVISSVYVNDDRTRPDSVGAGCIIELQYKLGWTHTEHTSATGEIRRAEVSFPLDSDMSQAMAVFLQAIGLRGKLGSQAADDYVTYNYGYTEPSRFAKLALKILYATPPGSKF